MVYHALNGTDRCHLLNISVGCLTPNVSHVFILSSEV